MCVCVCVCVFFLFFSCAYFEINLEINPTIMKICGDEKTLSSQRMILFIWMLTNVKCFDFGPSLRWESYCLSHPYQFDQSIVIKICLSDGNTSIRKCYMQAWNTMNVISPKSKHLCLSLRIHNKFRAKDSAFAGYFTALLYSIEICSRSTLNSCWGLRWPCSVGKNMLKLV